jgi:hypothetical protein
LDWFGGLFVGFLILIVFCAPWTKFGWWGGGANRPSFKRKGDVVRSMREDLAIDNTTSAVRELEKMQLGGLHRSLSVLVNTNVIRQQKLSLISQYAVF